MTAHPVAGRRERSPWSLLLQSQGALLALVAVVVFGALRYDNFVGAQNVVTTAVAKQPALFDSVVNCWFIERTKLR